MSHPPEFSTGRESPEPSCVSVKSGISMSHPPEFSTGRESPEPSCVSVKSGISMSHPPEFSTGTESPEPSCVSVKSGISMSHPPEFSTGRESPEPSCVSVKSGISMSHPPEFSAEDCPEPSWVYWGRSDLLQDPCCRNKSKTCLALHPHMEKSLNIVLQRVLQNHKISMKHRYESLYEGIKTPKNKTLLNRIYTQLYIIEGESEGVNEEHEVLHLEKKSSRYLQDTPINCLDIFKSVKCSEGETEDEIIRAGVDRGLRHSKSSVEDKEIRTVLTKGIAGIGKTVSVQKFILEWAEGKTNQDVDFMFVFPFREMNLIKDDQYSLHKLLCAFHPDLKDLDPKIYDTCKVVFIFDGLDESRIPLNFEECEKVSDVSMASSVGVLITNLLKGELLQSAHIWITSRPAAANQIPYRYISRVTEIQGFNDPQKEEYFRKRISDQDQAQKIISHIRTVSKLHIMCNIPVFCWISATVLQRILRQSDTEIPKTLTEMYCHFLITQTIMKNEKYEGSCDRDTVELLESNRTVLLKLAKLAFNQLMKGNVMFYEEDLRESGINLTEATLYSGIFREECVLYQRKVYSFVHLSFQEFLAALYVFHCYLIKNMELLMVFIPWDSRWPENVSLDVLLMEVVNKVSKSQNGHLDLFLRFLLGISLESSQKILQGLLIHTESSSESIKKTVQHIKEKMEDKDLPNDRANNLCLCLTEMNDQPFFRKIRKFSRSEKPSEYNMSGAECSALCCMLQMSEEVKDELDLKKYSNSCKAYVKLLPAVKNCRKALLEECNLTMNHCETLSSVLKSENSLIELNLSNNYLQDSGVELLSAGLKSSHCKLETLRLASCNLGIKTCEILGSVLNLENSTLTHLDLSNNDLQDSGGELLSAGLKSSNCKLQVLRLASCNLGIKTCEILGSVLNLANTSLIQLDLSNNDLQDSRVELLSAGLKSSHCKLQILKLALCNLGVRICEILGSVLTLENSLIEVDLSNNDLQDSGVGLLSAGLINSHCKLQTLRLSGCMVTDKGCSYLAAALSLNPSHLKELDLTYNHPGESGVKLLSARLEDSQHTLRVEHEGKIRIKPGLNKYGCDLTLDPNTAYIRLSLSEGNRKAVWGEEQPYPDHPERFDVCWQALSRESVTGRCYWEAEWSGRGAAVALSYKTISRKGGGPDCRFGQNENSWRLSCSNNRYSVYHNNNRTDLTCPPSGCRRVGVYVDCPAGTLSFYRVSPDTHTLTHLHTFNTTFTESVYAGFYVSDVGSSVRVI
ncbi:NACHT, LRR and PYD domains-containing protein 3-like [Astyanax mexicanus]|uniref:NACHT, LRR and PYD domains-containing protein 3-like n=1 Tax=Astyanax mexicanus TaxID=7994 RepID=UPI0020CAFF3B|nr:NACHT, LRR and PYD domains-containing protein 3-like [Astyanax mexicanus]